MSYFPLFLDIGGSKFLIVGAGEIALAKLESILEFTNNVTVLAKNSAPQISELITEKQIEFIRDDFKKDYLKNFDLIIAATNNTEVNQQIAEEGKKLGKLVNIVDDPKNSSFIFGANFKTSNIIISASTSGLSPVLARLIKQKIINILPKNLLLIDDFINKNKEIVKSKLSNLQARRLFWQDVIEGIIVQEIESGNVEKAQILLEEKLLNQNNKKEAAVYFIGAGPGDPELITLKAIKLLSRADVVLYDRLVSEEILAYARRDAIKINVGKTRDLHRYKQDEINQLIRKYASSGNIVARLKGGDPSLFARLSEEIDSIIDLNISYQIVPGITAASGAASYSGIPLTSRDSNKSVRFLTIYKDDLVNEDYWKDLSKTNDSLVFYMSSHNISSIIKNLINFGKDSKIPVAVIEQATTKFQKTYISSLGSFETDFKDQSFISPSLIIIGEVVAQHFTHKWQEESATGVYFAPIQSRINS